MNVGRHHMNENMSGLHGGTGGGHSSLTSHVINGKEIKLVLVALAAITYQKKKKKYLPRQPTTVSQIAKQ